MICTGKLESFKHGKKDVEEARKGSECGIGFEFFQDLMVGDQIQAIEEVRTKRTL
jgi:translation initiation factor IF-2